MKITTATLTFHAAHNYGSMLQAYALQHVIKSLGYDNKIINLRTERQKFIYRHPDDSRGASWRSKYIGQFIRLPFRKDLIRKYNSFEDFLEQDLDLTQEFDSLEEIADFAKQNPFDFYIVGSDQIWNTACTDFDWSFFLPFATSHNAISYACSMGQLGHLQVLESNYNRIRDFLSNFKAISVREKGTAEVIEKITSTTPIVHIDPTLLIRSDEWESDPHFIKEPLIKGDYIFVYTPAYKESVYDIAGRFGKLENTPVVYSSFHYQAILKHPSFKCVLPIGPWQFLNLIKYAKRVISGSFHAVAFSIIFKTPFFAVNGDIDNRMKDLLSLMRLDDLTINQNDVNDKYALVKRIDWSNVDCALSAEKEKSIEFLTHYLRIND